MNLCATTTGLPGIRRCTVLGQHRVTCPDHEGWADRPGTCRGCLPRLAEVGHLCKGCYERVVASVAAWPDFRAKLDATEGRAVAAEGGGGSALGFANLSLVFLAVDECERHLASRRGTVDHWVQTHQGAADAVMFSHAAARAWDALPVEPREERPVAPQRCPDCGFLSVYGHVSRKSRKGTVIDCRNCGYELDVVPTHVDRWAGSATCEHQLHTDCTNLNCGCPCHNVGAKSRPAGAQALWDADQFTTSPDVRAGWEIRDHLTIEPTKETRAA